MAATRSDIIILALSIMVYSSISHHQFVVIGTSRLITSHFFFLFLEISKHPSNLILMTFVYGIVLGYFFFVAAMQCHQPQKKNTASYNNKKWNHTKTIGYSTCDYLCWSFSSWTPTVKFPSLLASTATATKTSRLLSMTTRVAHVFDKRYKLFVQVGCICVDLFARFYLDQGPVLLVISFSSSFHL